MGNRHLTEAQRDHFARNGFVVVRDAVDEALLADLRDSVAETVPEDLTDFDALVDGPERRNYWGDLDEMEPFGNLNELLFEYAEQLVGDGALQSPGKFTQVAVRYPEGQFASDPDRVTTADDGNPHVDGFEADGTYRPFTVGVTTYLDDVNPRGGGLTVWPGSHWRVAEYFEDHDLEEFSNDDVPAILGGSSEPFEITGEAGTVALWHDKLVHTGGVNLSRRPRMASFTRLVRPDEAAMCETPERPFEGWAGVHADGAVTK